MKKSFFISAIFTGIFISNFTFSQSASLPYAQGFEDNFILSPEQCTKAECLVAFLPAWQGNEVKVSSRIYRDTLYPKSGRGALGMIPLSDFNPEALLHVNLAGHQAVSLEFFASHAKNGKDKDTRASLLFLSYSLDGGTSFSKEIEIDSFENSISSGYSKYEFLINQTGGHSDVLVKIKARRASNNEGQAAKILLDDLTVLPAVVSDADRSINEREGLFLISRNSDGIVFFNRAITGMLYNACGVHQQAIHESTSMDSKNIASGLYLLKTDKGESLKIVVTNE